jgi:hypothetical protein
VACVKLSRRESAVEAELPLEETEDRPEAGTASKGRPTPKRRDSQGRRGPVAAPRTRKEAYARQKQLAKEQKVSRSAARPRTVAEQRAALKRGDPDALPNRDKGKTKQLARDYVDSHRLVSNYLLLLFPVMVIGIAVPVAQLFVLAAFFALMVEWYIVGRRVRALALERYGEAQGGNFSIGFYAGSRAYLIRRWRLPAPRVDLGDEI